MSRPVGQGEKTKKKIALVAKELFELKGYKSTSVSDIQAKCGLSKGIIYHHFKNKEELYLYCLEDASNNMFETWKDEVSNIETAKEKLYVLAEIYAKDTQSALTRTLTDFFATNNEKHFKKNILRLIEPEKAMIESIIQEGIISKEFKIDIDITKTTFILFSMLIGLGSTEYLGYENSISDIYKNAITLFLEGLNK